MKPQALHVQSPNGQHAAQFEPLGEVYLGVPLYRLEVDGLRIESTRYTKNRWVFGAAAVWSQDSRWLAAQCWDIPDRGPQTSIIVLDLVVREWRCVGPGYRAMMLPLAFDGEWLQFETVEVASGKAIRGQVHLGSALSRWGTIDPHEGLM